MKNDSSEKYLKYLAALALSVATPAAAQSELPQPAEATSVVASDQTSENLHAVMFDESDQDGLGDDTSWPESTYVRRPIPPGVARPANVDTSLVQMMDDVLKTLD